MWNRLLLLPTFLLLTAGCTHPRPVTLDHPDGLARLERRSTRRTATVTLAGALQVGRDSMSWLAPTSGDVMRVATREVAAVRFLDRGRGAFDGLATGVLTGREAGAVVGLVSGDINVAFRRLTAEEKATAFGLLGDGIGAVAGATGGAVVGGKDVYRLNESAGEAGDGEGRLLRPYPLVGAPGSGSPSAPRAGGPLSCARRGEAVHPERPTTSPIRLRTRCVEPSFSS